MQTSEFYSPDQPLPMIIPPRSPSPDITYPYPLFKQDDEHKRTPMKPNQVRLIFAKGPILDELLDMSNNCQSSIASKVKLRFRLV